LFVAGGVIGHFKVLADDGNGQFGSSGHGNEAKEHDLIEGIFVVTFPVICDTKQLVTLTNT